jgi:hypothetical protein
VLQGTLDLDEEENILGLIRKKVLGKEGSKIEDLLLKLGLTGFDRKESKRKAKYGHHEDPETNVSCPMALYARTPSSPPQSGNKSQVIKRKIDMIRFAHS